MELNSSQMLGPFLEAVAQVQEEAKKAAKLPLASGQREALEALSSELRSHRERFEAFAPSFIEMAGRQMDENRKQVEVLLRRKDELLLSMDSLARQADEAIALADRKMDEASKKPSLTVPRPKQMLPEKAVPLELSAGDVLRDFLASTPAERRPPTASPSGSATSGKTGPSGKHPQKPRPARSFPRRKGTGPRAEPGCATPDELCSLH